MFNCYRFLFQYFCAKYINLLDHFTSNFITVFHAQKIMRFRTAAFLIQYTFLPYVKQRDCKKFIENKRVVLRANFKFEKII